MINNSESGDAEPEIRPERKALRRIIHDAEIGKEGGMLGLPSGLIELDRITGGWKNASLNVVAGAPSMGCTSLLLAFMRNAVTDFYRGVAFFSLQMPCQKLLTKWLSAELKVPYNKVESGQIRDDQWQDINRLLTSWDRDLEDLSRIIDAPAPTIGKIVADCKRLRKEGIELFLIDNINRITLGKRERAFCANREQELSYIVRRLKTLARELEAPVVVVSQLSRSVLDRGRSNRPQLADLRDSGAIENEADLVILLYRPEYYGHDQDAEGNSTYNTAELIIAKNMFGETDTALVQFKAAYGRFDNLEQDESSIPTAPAAKVSFMSSAAPFPKSNFSNEEPPF